MIFVVGSGRCGTQSVASMLKSAGLNVGHEEQRDVTVPLAAQFTAGRRGLDEMVELLGWLISNREIGDGAADFKMSELIDPLAALYPESKFLWVTREPKATIISLWRNGWFDPRDDDAWPFMFMQWEHRESGAWANIEVNPQGWRTTAPLVGELPWWVWREWPQPARCMWWWSWVNRRIGEQLMRLPEDRWLHQRLEDLDAEQVCGFAGAPRVARLPWLDRSVDGFEWGEDEALDAVFDSLVGPVAAALGY